ncbi:MAG TPA: peptidase M28 [Nitrospira sp.]|nr:peptidase M28 [Nitrospira sp.]
MSPQRGIGREIHDFVAELYPLCRSITGEGLRTTLRHIQKRIPLTVHEIPTGTPVFDWTIPKEWNIRDAYIKDSNGKRVVDFQQSNLHVVSYSVPVHRQMSLDELKPHLFSLPDHPDWIPYRTSYYRESWGFCVSHKQLLTLRDDNYEVCIDSSLEAGHLSYGECYLNGEQEEEILISCHVCHPSLCNDNLSGVALGTLLAETLAHQPRRYSYRFLFLPVTVGAIAWLALNKAQTKKVRHGMVLTCVGDRGKLTYKRSRSGRVDIDRAAIHTLQHGGKDFSIQEFSPYGYDERQYCSPGFDLPVGCFMRTPNGCFQEYHTSADNLEFVTVESLADSYEKMSQILEIIERNETYVSLNQECEPQLGKKGLYRAPGSEENLALLWVLNLSDGRHSLLDIAERSGMVFGKIRKAADDLMEAGLIKPIGRS